MKPTDILKNEHRVIEIVLHVLHAMAGQMEKDKKVDGQSARQALDFFQNFADRCHHGKEENHLFTWMEAHGYPRDGGPTGVMFYEHEQGRLHIQAMRQALDRLSEKSSDSQRQFVEHARSYVQLLREHIEKEDHCLFTMADQAMSEDDRQQMLQAFERTEKEDIGEGVHETFVSIAKDLAQKYDIDINGLPATVFEYGCGH
jgi:hemerythrin-like domain-containing protein